MKHTKHLLVVAFLVLAGMALPQLRVSNSLAAGKESSPLDEKHWSLYALPYFDSDYSRRPIVVRSVTMDASRGLAITKVGIFNRSKAVKAVKLKWYLSDDKNKGVVILQGETPSIKIDKG